MLFGDLYLTSISSVTQKELGDAFSKVYRIQGNLVISDNLDLSALWFLKSLRSVRSVTIVNNALLADARLPKLSNVSTVAVLGNPRLCEAMKPLSAATVTTGCVTFDASQLISVSNQLPLLDNISSVLSHFINASIAIQDMAGLFDYLGLGPVARITFTDVNAMDETEAITQDSFEAIAGYISNHSTDGSSVQLVGAPQYIPSQTGFNSGLVLQGL